MSTHRLAPYSPTHHRDPHRASTGNVYVTSYDTVSSGHSGRSSVSTTPSRSSNVTYEAQPIRKTIDADGKKTQYIVRPRHNSTSGQDVKRPLSISTARNLSPPRRSSHVSPSPREIMSAGLPRESPNRLLQPSSALVPRHHTSHHQRHSSATRAEIGDYETYRPRKERVYHAHDHELPKQYYVSRAQPARQPRDEDWSYTGPREQFARDYPQHTRRDSQTRRERPVNAYDSDREVSTRRGYGPPPSSNRQLDRIDKYSGGKSTSRSGFDSDPDRANEPSRRQSLRAPAVLHQHLRDEGYSSSRDDYESRSHAHKHNDDGGRRERSRRESMRETDRDRRRDYEYDEDYDRPRHYDQHDSKEHRRRKSRTRDTSHEDSRFKDVATGALGAGLATAGVGSLMARENKDKVFESDDDGTKRQHHSHRRRHHKTDVDDGDNPPEELDERRRHRKRDESSSESYEEKPRRRRHSRRRQRDGVDNDNDGEAGNFSDPQQRPPRPRSLSRVRPEEDDRERSGRELVPVRHERDDTDYIEARTFSPGENSDDRARKVLLVEPEKREEVKPRGILKPARQIPFPEDPNPIREGVAPLKDAKKDGVPPNARWTKISRVLVNPEALEKASERFEERDDYVIVLRVVSKDEIQKLAEKTAQIRAARETEWEKRVESKSRDRSRDHKPDHTDDDDDEDEDAHQPLAIEAPPSTTPMDLRNLSQPQQSHQYQPQSAPMRAEAGGKTVPDVQVSQSYSQNV